MHRAPFTPAEFAALRREPGHLTPGQSAALLRARELASELTELVASVRARLAEGEVAASEAQPAPARRPALVERPPPRRARRGRLGAGEMRAAFSVARDTSRFGPRPRWADGLGGDSP